MIPDGSAKVIVGHPLKETMSVIPGHESPDEWIHIAEQPITDIERIPRDTQERRN
jgi:hypothetical protein